MEKCAYLSSALGPALAGYQVDQHYYRCVCKQGVVGLGLVEGLHFQVLISIQSMILCDEPYLNEPGWANGGGTPQSKACKSVNDGLIFCLLVADSANVRRMVVRTAVRVSLPSVVVIQCAADVRELEGSS